jgi:endo-1,4-beta-xylanase
MQGDFIFQTLESRRLLSLPVARLFALQSSTGEGRPAATIQVVLDRVATTSTTIHYSLSGSAQPGGDFASLAGVVTIPVGARSADVVVEPLSDASVESVERVVINLVSGTGYSLAESSSRRAEVRLFDADPQIAGVAVAEASTLTNFVAFGPGIVADIVPAAGPAFTQAYRVQTTARPDNKSDIQLAIFNTTAVEANDVIVVRFHARNAGPVGSVARVDAVFEQAWWPFTKSVTQHFDLQGNSWQPFQLAFRSSQNHGVVFGDNRAQLSMHLGFDPQSFELGGVSITNLGSAVNPDDIFATENAHPGREGLASWRVDADARIEQLRKADLDLIVVDHLGNPIADAPVEIELKRHAFGFGSAAPANTVVDFWSPVTEQFRNRFLDLFNQATIEWELQWLAWGELYGSEQAFKAIDWFLDQGIDVRGHAGIYPLWSRMLASPGDTYGGINYRADPTVPDPLEEYNAHVAVDGVDAARQWLRDRMREHTEEKLSHPRLKGRVRDWDVVNEPFPTRFEAMGVVGNDELIEQLRRARIADPDAKLFVNDYPNLAGDGHLNYYLNLIPQLISAGVPIDGLGLQSHFFSVGDAGIDAMKANLDALSATGVRLQITEYDFVSADEQLQADFLRDYLTLAFSHPGVDAFSFWGFWDGLHWRPGAGLYRQDWSLRPQGQVYLDLLKEVWNTEASLSTTATGQASIRGFLGTYEVEIMLDGRLTRATVSLDAGGSAATVVVDRSDVTPPTLENSGFQFDYAQAMRLEFSESILGLNADDVTIMNITTGQALSMSNVWLQIQQIANKTVMTAWFTSPLADGDYEIRTRDASGTDAVGYPLPATSSEFFVLAGDANRDRRVDFADLLIVSQNYGQSGRAFSQGNFDYAGAVDFSDLLIVAQQFGAQLLSSSERVGRGSSHLLGMLDAEQVQPRRQRPGRQRTQRQA